MEYKYFVTFSGMRRFPSLASFVTIMILDFRNTIDTRKFANFGHAVSQPAKMDIPNYGARLV